MTKAQYEQKLGPLLNDVVAPAMGAVLGHGGARNPQRVSAAITSVRLAHDQMTAVTPPTEVAELHRQAVAVLASMITDMTKLRDAEIKDDRNRISSAAAAVKTDGQRLVSLGNRFTSRGY